MKIPRLFVSTHWCSSDAKNRINWWIADAVAQSPFDKSYFIGHFSRQTKITAMFVYEKRKKNVHRLQVNPAWWWWRNVRVCLCFEMIRIENKPIRMYSMYFHSGDAKINRQSSGSEIYSKDSAHQISYWQIWQELKKRITHEHVVVSAAQFRMLLWVILLSSTFQSSTSNTLANTLPNSSHTFWNVLTDLP